jgi:hypothetical protein
MTKATGILATGSGGEMTFYYPVAYDMWAPLNDTYVRISPFTGVEIITLTADEVGTGKYRPVRHYGDESGAENPRIWLTPETMLKHMRQVALVLAKSVHETAGEVN